MSERTNAGPPAKPELLAPAGSFAALRAAIDAGADAVYFGLSQFNARMHAENFTLETVGEAITLCRLFGVKTHIVLNTQLYDRELASAVTLAGELLSLGADAFIVADLGLARLLTARYPNICLHASTQACGENVLSAKALADIGFSRMVASRELPLRDIVTLSKESLIETEIFVHGALCVSHSGQCLMSAVIGGRSGNRGECAQPCRLPYRAEKSYPLSLKDLCLAEHIPEIMEARVASLKIEGRMKSPDYVYGVTSIYRRLLDERRAATSEELERLDRLFSRSGFTDGYFTEHISDKMLGIRTEENKRAAIAVPPRIYGIRRLPLSLKGTFLVGKPATLVGEVTRGDETVCAEAIGDICVAAEKTPTDKDRLRENLSKLGATVFQPKRVSVLENGVNIPISRVNALRRSLCARLAEKLVGARPTYDGGADAPLPTESVPSDAMSAYFAFADAVTPKAIRAFDRIFLPIGEYLSHPALSERENIGIAFPPVCFDHEREALFRRVKAAKEKGCRMALVTGLWQCEMADACGMEKHGDLRLNVFNSHSAAVYCKMGFSSMILSAELPPPAAARVRASLPRGYVAYGRLPLMTLEKCIIRDNVKGEFGASCHHCDAHHFYMLTDRTGARFPVCREFSHRNVIYNSVPVYMGDRPIAGLFRHCIFTDESGASVDAILSRMEKKLPPEGGFKRL